MNKPDSPALQTALAYYEAWRSRDHSTAMNVVADNVVAETPFGRLEGGAALHESETEFANILTGATLIASFGDEDTALLLYNTHTLPFRAFSQRNTSSSTTERSRRSRDCSTGASSRKLKALRSATSVQRRLHRGGRRRTR
jgi:hypothetical protein